MNNLNKQITDRNRVTFIEAKLSYQGNKLSYMTVEVCMGMGKTGIPWDSHGNGNTISHGNGMGMGIRRMGMGIKTWEWEKKSPHTKSPSCAIHVNSWAANGSQSRESCIQLLIKSCVCHHFQLPAREYLALLVDYWRSAEQTHREL